MKKLQVPPTSDVENLDSEVEASTDRSTVEAADQDAEANIVALLESLAAVTRERDEARDGMVRAMAELQNVRRRSNEQLEQTRKVATEGLVVRLLPVLDNFERSLRALESGANVEAVSDGVKGIEKQFRGALESVRVERIVAVGEPFDPERHEAIGVVETDQLPTDTVYDEVEPGYLMAGVVIRPARVRVAKSS